MVNFRRVVTVLAVLALFTGLAFAQQENCSAQATSSTPLRAEGYTEQTGDIQINCYGGIPIAAGQPIPLVNFTVFYNTQVTSRLLPTTVAPTTNQTSEALLIIDDPNTWSSATSNYGSSLPLIPCTTPQTGCAAWVGNVAGSTFNQAVQGLGSTVNSPNVYQGIVNGNSVTFYGVPVLPPSTVGSRVYRIVNVRVNAQALAGGSASGASPVQSSIVISGSASLPISNSAPVVGYVSNSLTAGVSGAGNYKQCVSVSGSKATTLKFTETGFFGSAFKTRVAAQQNTAYAGQGIPPDAPALYNQSTPGTIYNSESNFVYNAKFGANGYTVGEADFGTRFKATFNNVPAGVRIFVQTSNVAAPAVIGGSAANGNTPGVQYVGYAALVSGETVSDGAGVVPVLTATDNAGGLGIAEVAIVNGTGTAVWEVINTNINTVETFAFPVYISYTAATATNSPLPGASTVNLSYAPTSTAGVASTSASVPRFAGDTLAARTFVNIGVCRTVLLYPYITNQGGFDTGLTVANTSQDPFTTGNNATGAQSGACTFTFYGGTTAAPTTPPAPVTVGNDPTGKFVMPGSVWANTLGTIAPTFQGYAFAICNFQFAHGFAFISDIGARNLAMGYLALIIPDVTVRGAYPFGGDITVATGEQDAH